MLLLVIYILIALGFSFLCSIVEAVLLSITVPHIAMLQSQGKSCAPLLQQLKEDINKPLAAILTLNTIAHTAGAAGAGAQAAAVFGSNYVGISSAILTLLILVFSEIIPKTLGAHYWRHLAPMTAYCLKFLIWVFYPFVKLTERLTRSLTEGPTLRGINRKELIALAELSGREGALADNESLIMQNLLRLRETPAKAAMTPRTVVFSISQTLTVDDYFSRYEANAFSRIPIYDQSSEDICGFVLRSDLLLAKARNQLDRPVSDFSRDLPQALEQTDLSNAFDRFLKERVHIMLIKDEHGGVSGILTLEDVLETLLGLEIIDEFDANEDMQVFARKLWEQRARQMGLDIDKL
ncbi:CNNM domain-containing protein [Geopsychrobacter electrodiphilus]|uniref:CNNM domain-containing protein n=1 Tax=Geopsychrobacter electrodiphilus TaxID=225196 RepID=UPI00036B7C56|nr:hemolysin family protein [Geopsychrobacter electrodiphilus]